MSFPNMVSSTSSTICVLGKRRKRSSLTSNDGFVLHLSASEAEPEAGSSSGEAAGNKTFVNGARPYVCTFEGCTKAYRKPSRLLEHERSHTGERPYVCTVCSKSYLRDTHLAAHSRMHMPESEKPFECPSLDCNKRFWTAQHLRVHIKTHSGERPFQCTFPECSESFTKHHQLRSHICSIHSPPGTKPYICPHNGCTKSFTTNQKLRAHSKAHADKRYTCGHPHCLSSGSTNVYYPTWSALQHHMRTVHPPVCPHSSCGGRVFAQQKGLRAHMRLHEQRDVEAELDKELLRIDANEQGDSGTVLHTDEDGPRKRRRGGEVGRDWKCEEEGCSKDFKSKKALTIHHNVAHLHRRDFVCSHAGCGSAFGYKHLLQRHIAKLHATDDGGDGDESTHDLNEDTDEQNTDAEGPSPSTIDLLTGKLYAGRVQHERSLCCPYPQLSELGGPEIAQPEDVGGSQSCDYVFTRAYDLRRHLKAEHDFEALKDVADTWVMNRKKICGASQPV